MLPTAILSLYDRHPGIAVGLHEFGHRLELEQNVRSGVADIAVGPRPLQPAGPGSGSAGGVTVASSAARPLAAADPRQRVPLAELAERRPTSTSTVKNAIPSETRAACCMLWVTMTIV